MTYLRLSIISIVLLGPFLQSGESPQRYNYHILGAVLDEHARELANLNVCVIPAWRPINGRIPCTKTNRAGAFSITVRDIPDKYRVCASTGETPFVLVGQSESENRVVCSNVLEFQAKDETVRVSLQFKSKK